MHVNIIFIQTISQGLESIFELLVRQFSRVVLISLLEHGHKSPLEGADESRGVNVHKLSFLFLFVEILNLHNIESGYEGIDLLSLGIDESGKFELGTKMKHCLDLKFVFEKLIDPFLIHSRSHGVTDFMPKGLTFKIKIKLIVVFAISKLSHIEVALDGDLSDRLSALGL